jgi:hypothetical protein
MVAITATSQKEDTPVKKPQSPPPRQPSSTPLGKRAAKAAGFAASCALAAGCPSIPVRPTPKECPAAAINSMRALGIDRAENGMGYSQLWLDADRRDGREHTFRAGPIVGFISALQGWAGPPKGTLLFGEVIPGGGREFFIRYYEAQLPGSTERVPVCAVAGEGGLDVGLEKQPGSTDDTFTHSNSGYVQFVTKFAE